MKSVLDELSDKDRYTFQSRRYSIAAVWVQILPSGAVIVADHARDPVEIVHSFEQLQEVLSHFSHQCDLKVKRQLLDQQRLREEELEKKLEDDDLATIKIDL